MATLHRGSPCCGASVRKFGNRRRQCGACKKTWRIFRHRRGRRGLRAHRRLVERIVEHADTVHEQAAHFPSLTESGIKYRFQRALQAEFRRPRVLPRLRGAYTLIADGLWYRFARQEWVLYLMILKPRRRNYGYLLDPVMFPGRERFGNWMVTVDTIPKGVRKRISSFVSDHFSASELVADTMGWIHQLCHFHLIAELQKRRGRRKWKLRGASIREEVYQCVVQLLRRDSRHLTQRLILLIARKECPRKIRMIVREYLRSRNRYAAYRRHPELTMPNTTGAVESLGKLIRKRTWMLRTPQYVLQWTTAFVRLRKYIQCNGKRHHLKISTKLTA